MYCAVASRSLTEHNTLDVRARGLLGAWLHRAGFEWPVGEGGAPLAGLRHVSTGLRAEIVRARNEMLRIVHSVEPDAVPDVLLTLLAMRSASTYRHSLRVGRTAASLAGALGLPAEEVSVIRSAGLLHDIGKAAIPTRILGFRGRPSDEDVVALRLHVTIGQEVLDAVPAFAAAATMVGATHERFDGKGYPNRTSGTAIPLGARIISVSDVFDAMTAVRPYRAPLTPTEANRELARVAGTQLDPDVVDAWIRMTETRPC
jgi:putative nucleotidyltransferase with HDIG domain